MWRDLFVLCLVPLAVLASPMSQGYKDDGYDNGGYDKDSYGDKGESYTKDDGYGKKMTCTPVFDTVFQEFCESYFDRVCRTTHQEKCVDVPDQNCRAVMTNQQKRKCFEVDEVVCKLREDVKYQTVQVGYTVQKCSKVQERVCDTVFDTSFTTKEKSTCINVRNPFCSHEEKTIVDKTCRTTTKFDCPTETHGSDSGYGGSGYGSGGSGYGSDSYGKDSYGSDSYGKDSYGKDIEKPQCRRSASTSCYDTPRTVVVPRCSSKSDKVCEAMPQRYPTVSERQHCHNEDKKVCQLEERTQPKQVKKYVYTKQCRKVPRKVCENADNKSLVPSCVPSVRKECTYHPMESCDEIPKQHCFKVGKKVKKEKCEASGDAAYPDPAYPDPAYPDPAYPDPAYPKPEEY